VTRMTFAMLVAAAVLACPPPARAQVTRQSDVVAVGAGVVDSAGVVPSDYVIGADDVLSVIYWREKDMSAEVTVRPDGKVALPLVNDLQAAGLTPDAFRDRVMIAARRFVEDPNPTVMVKTINSRRVYITGQVEKPGTYALNNAMSVLQLVALAGGLKEFARGSDISIIRAHGSEQEVFRFNYQDALKRKNLSLNIALKPGDTVLVP
jgi:polysaccharide export outer membrane protein